MSDAVDLSSLSAAADQHWSEFMAATLAGVDDVVARRAPSIGVSDQLVLWMRPTLAVAMVLILMSITLIHRERSVIEVRDGPYGMATITRVWAGGGPAPSGAVIEGVIERSFNE